MVVLLRPDSVKLENPQLGKGIYHLVNQEEKLTKLLHFMYLWTVQRRVNCSKLSHNIFQPVGTMDRGPRPMDRTGPDGPGGRTGRR
ncbi:hypothetical protein ZOSMA_8124G00010, partial [Zostera marina]